MTTGLAIFVKTPGHSPIKTRLAATIGKDAALEFHGLSARAVAEVACAAQASGADLEPYWAIAEHHAMSDPRWCDLSRLWQGEGALGERLYRIYARLHATHERVLLLGADAPQVTPELLRRACDCLSEPATCFVLGEAHDGGFWLFGGRLPIGREVWCSVRYSCAETAAQLRDALQPPGVIGALPTLTDVDEAVDLDALDGELAGLPMLLPAQRALLCWIAARRATLGVG